MKNKIIFWAILFSFIASISFSLTVRAEMIKIVDLGFLVDAPNPIEAERFYLKHHGPEIVSKMGPWLARYVLYPVYNPPPEAVDDPFGAVGGRYAELWYRSVDDYNTKMPIGTLTPAPWQERSKGPVYAAKIPAVPTEFFLDTSPNPEQTTIIRWIQLIKYPGNVSTEDGEKWFLEVHAKEALKQPGLLKFISYKCIDKSRFTRASSANEWVRVNEYWYKSLDDWRKAIIEDPPQYTPPSWGGEYPFVEMGSTFIDYYYDIDFLKGNYVVP